MAKAFKRLQTLTTEELRKQLQQVPELGLSSRASSRVVTMARSQVPEAKHPTLAVVADQTDLAGLPLLRGVDCQIGKEAAESLTALSRRLRIVLNTAVDATGVDPRVKVETVRNLVQREEWRQSDAVPTLTQLLCAEDKPVRLLMVELLDQIPGKEATLALAQRAVFDLSPEVREAAVKSLKPRPDQNEARTVFLQGLRYPWAPAADHAAEALVNLEDVQAVPELVRLLDKSSPNSPARKEGDADRWPVVREMVGVNHLSNCVTCHAE